MKITNNVGQYVTGVINCNLKLLRMTQKIIINVGQGIAQCHDYINLQWKHLNDFNLIRETTYISPNWP
jgi:hypothetical protein